MLTTFPPKTKLQLLFKKHDYFAGLINTLRVMLLTIWWRLPITSHTYLFYYKIDPIALPANFLYRVLVVVVASCMSSGRQNIQMEQIEITRAMKPKNARYLYIVHIHLLPKKYIFFNALSLLKRNCSLVMFGYYSRWCYRDTLFCAAIGVKETAKTSNLLSFP